MTAVIDFEKPSATDGLAVFRLISACPPLDTNSVYCNLLQCHHFADTSVTAKLNGEIAGFISGYLVPGKRDTLFIWQVAVSEAARGQGLASQMVAQILERDACESVRFLETTITGDNNASWALFERIAKQYASELRSEDLFDKETHFSGEHATEILVTIGPLRPAKNA